MEISMNFVPRVPIKNIPALVQIMAWRRLGDKPLSEPMMDSLPTHICVTRPQWVNWYYQIEFVSIYIQIINLNISAILFRLPWVTPMFVQLDTLMTNVGPFLTLINIKPSMDK